MHTAAGLVHADFRLPDFDYVDLMKLTAALTRSYTEKEELFRRLVFNVLAGNRDDHAKNFAYLLNFDREWVNSPAYDLTFNAGIGGEHSMSVNGRGKEIRTSDLLAVADAGSISHAQARSIVEEVAGGVNQWRTLSREYGVPVAQIDRIGNYIDRRLFELAGASAPVSEGR